MSLISPYGGALSAPMAAAPRLDDLLQEAAGLPALVLNRRQQCDLELLLNGAFSPLRGWMGRDDFERVLTEMRLEDGTFWPMPLALDLNVEQASKLGIGSRVVLCDGGGRRLAILTVNDIWQADRALEAGGLYRADRPGHPGLAYLEQLGSHYVGGRLEGLSLPRHGDFAELRLTPSALRERLTQQACSRVIAFQPRQVMHRAQYEFTQHCAEENDAGLLLQALAGEEPKQAFFTRIRCIQALLPRYPQHMAQLGLLPLISRQSGAREVLWQAIVARNYGASHFIIGGDAGAGEIRRGSDALSSEWIQPLAEHFAAIGVEPITFPRMVYAPALKQYMPEEYLPQGQESLSMTGAELQNRIHDGRQDVPDWATLPEVLEELRICHPLRLKRGFTIFFTGLSGAGKTTLSQALYLKLMELTGRPVTLLDGDEVRTLLSSGLTFSRADRDLNIRRIGFVAAEITRQGGIAICAPIAPYRETRQAVREMTEPVGGFFEVHVSTPLEVCEGRDPKGLYAKARAGIIKEFTGVSDPYEVPHAPEISINTGMLHVEEGIEKIVSILRDAGAIA